MPIYEYKGQQYEIETDDPQVAKSKILKFLETGKTTTGPSVPKKEPTPTENFMKPLREMSVEDWQKQSLLFPALQTLGSFVPGAPNSERMRQEGLAGLSQKGGQIFEGLKNVVQNPIEAGKAAYSAITERPMETAGNVVKGLIYDPEQLLLGPAAGAAAKGTVATAKAGTQVAKGAVGNVRGAIAKPGAIPEPWQMPSARQPVGSTYIKPEDLAAWRAAGSPANALPLETPIGSLLQQPGVTSALQRTGGNIPLEGQAARAYGEQLAEQYTKHPLGSLVRDAALAGTGYMLGGPVGAGVAKGTQLAYDAFQAARNASAARKLSQQGFSQLTPQERALLANRTPGQTPGPANPNMPPPGGMPPPIVPPAGGAAAPTSTTPAQANAASLGITPPMTAAESGFTQQLDNLALGAAIPETAPMPRPIETPPAPTAALGPAVPETAPVVAEVPTPKVETAPTVSGVAPETTYSRTAPRYEPGNLEIQQRIDQIVAANPEAAPYTQKYVIPEKNSAAINSWLDNTSTEKNILMTGDPGTGKTSLAKEWKNRTGGEDIYLAHQTFFKGNKISDSLKQKIDSGNPILLVADEADNFTPAQVKALQQLQTHDNVSVLSTTNKTLDELKKKSDWWQNNSEVLNSNVNLTPAQKQVFGLSRALESGTNLTPDEILAQSLQGKNFRDIKRNVQEGMNTKASRSENAIFGNVSDSMETIQNSSLPGSVKDRLLQFENNDTQKNLMVFDKNALSRQEINELKKAYTVLDEGLDDPKLLDSLTGKGNQAQNTYFYELGTDADVAALNKLKNIIERSNESQFPGRLVVVNKTATKPEPAIINRAYVITKDDMKRSSGEIMKDVSKMAQSKPPTGTFGNLFEE